jgi:hypothetical protein
MGQSRLHFNCCLQLRQLNVTDVIMLQNKVLILQELLRLVRVRGHIFVTEGQLLDETKYGPHKIASRVSPPWEKHHIYN